MWGLLSEFWSAFFVPLTLRWKYFYTHVWCNESLLVTEIINVFFIIIHAKARRECIFINHTSYDESWVDIIVPVCSEWWCHAMETPYWVHAKLNNRCRNCEILSYPISNFTSSWYITRTKCCFTNISTLIPVTYVGVVPSRIIYISTVCLTTY